MPACPTTTQDSKATQRPRSATPASQLLAGQHSHETKLVDNLVGSQEYVNIVQSAPQEVPLPSIVQLLSNKDHRWSGIVRDFEHCQELTRQYVSISDKTGRANVPISNDFPEDKTAQKELVRQLFEAILEVDPTVAGHMHTKRIQNLSNFEVELLAWELLVRGRVATSPMLRWSLVSNQPSHAVCHTQGTEWRRRAGSVGTGVKQELREVRIIPGALRARQRGLPGKA